MPNTWAPPSYPLSVTRQVRLRPLSAATRTSQPLTPLGTRLRTVFQDVAPCSLLRALGLHPLRFPHTFNTMTTLHFAIQTHSPPPHNTAEVCARAPTGRVDCGKPSRLPRQLRRARDEPVAQNAVWFLHRPSPTPLRRSRSQSCYPEEPQAAPLGSVSLPARGLPLHRRHRHCRQHGGHTPSRTTLGRNRVQPTKLSVPVPHLSCFASAADDLSDTLHPHAS